MSETRFELTLPSPLADMVRTCEVVCVVGCCGTDAFEIDPKHMSEWIREQGIQRAFDAFEQWCEINQLVAEQDGEIWSEEDFNAAWQSSVECGTYLMKWRPVILQAIESHIGRAVFNSTWRTSTVLSLARGIHDDRAFDRLPILADALQDAGCEDAAVLAHCRGDGPHVRGCWVVDLVLGKS